MSARMARRQANPGLEKSNFQGRYIGFGMNPDKPVGVGQNTQMTAADSVLTCGFTQVPVIEYVTWTVNLPVAFEFVGSTFGDTINLLAQGAQGQSVPGVTDVDSSFVANGSLQVDMLVFGFGIHVFAEPQQGSVLCNYFTPSTDAGAGAVPPSPDVFTVADATPSTGALALPTGSTLTPAILEWGVCAQNALWHMVNGYQFQWIMQQRFLLINELAADVAYFGSYAEAVAAGSSQQAAQRYFNRVNQTYQSPVIGDPGVLLPINAQRVGSVTGTPNSGVFHPTRAYDLMDVTYGGLRAQGMTGMVQPFRRLFKPVLLERGIGVGMLLRAQDEYHVSLMQQYLSNNDQQNGTHTLMSISSTTSGATTAFPELTFSDTANSSTVLNSVTVNTDRVLYKGGAMQVAILIKGFEVWGPWKTYIQNQLVGPGLVTTPHQAAQTTSLPQAS
jgi:hypothetical protein